MFAFLRRWIAREPPLEGRPSHRRQKTWSAESGYVYLYYFEGFRDRGNAWHYVFTVSSDRREWFPVAVVLERRTAGEWAALHGRELTPSERFGVAKVGLRRAFDALPDPRQVRSGIEIGTAELHAIAEFLELV